MTPQRAVFRKTRRSDFCPPRNTTSSAPPALGTGANTRPRSASATASVERGAGEPNATRSRWQRVRLWRRWERSTIHPLRTRSSKRSLRTRLAARRRPSPEHEDAGGLAGLFDFGDAGLDHLRHQPVWKGLIGGKLDRALTQQVALEFSGVGLRDTVANPIQGVMRLPVAKVGDRLPFELVANDAVAHAFGCLRRPPLDALAELFQRRLLVLRGCGEVIIDCRTNHAEAIALRVGEDDIVRVRRSLAPVDFGGTQRFQPLDLASLILGVQVEMDPRRHLHRRVHPVEGQIRPAPA